MSKLSACVAAVAVFLPFQALLNAADIAQWNCACVVTVHGTAGNAIGSGVLVNRKPAIVMTAWHVMSQDLRRPITVYFPATGERAIVLWYRRAAGCDVVAMELDRQVSVSPVAVASRLPARGEYTTLAAFPRGEPTAFTARVYPMSHQVNASLIELTGPCVSGESGGMVLNTSGALVGIISGVTDDGHSMIATGARIEPIRLAVAYLLARKAGRASPSAPKVRTYQLPTRPSVTSGGS